MESPRPPRVHAAETDADRAALLAYKVVFFRDQSMTPEQHIAFARRFGPLEIHPATPQDQPNREVLHIAHGPDSRGRENFWHSDVTWRAEPSLGSILRAIEVPEVGGELSFKEFSIVRVRFGEESGKLTTITLVQPNGEFTAKKK